MSKSSKLRRLTSVVAAPTKNFFKTYIRAQLASAGPPLGPLLGKFGINISNFCKDFNKETEKYKKGIPFPVTVKVNPDRTYKIELHSPPTTFLMNLAAGVPETRLKREKYPVGKVTIKHIYEIAKIKMDDPTSNLQVYDMKEAVTKLVGLAYKKGIMTVRTLNPKQYARFLKAKKAMRKQLKRELAKEMPWKKEKEEV